jgi:uncharacterized protein with ParB-like and HNH nuclease domain
MADISVDRESVSSYLKSGAKHPFLIPDYQRPYSWGDDEVTTLWDDIKSFFSEDEGNNEYFCGTVVTFKNENNQNEIIDGQQRTTTLLLLLRAIYHKLETSPEQDDRTAGLKRQIDPCIWRVDSITQKPDRNAILIDSKVTSDENNEIFLKILRDGELSENQDQYSKNYALLVELVTAQAANSPIGWFDLVVNILNRVIVLPIECSNQDTALTIFSTLNDRGLALSDADIFKAKLYSHSAAEDRDKFITQWKELEETSDEANINVQSLFNFFMFYLRAKEGDKATTTPGMRKFFQTDHFKRLYEPSIMSELINLAGFWRVLTVLRADSDYEFSSDISILKSVQILWTYTNDWWKYSVSTYYLVHHGETDFTQNFLNFLHQLIANFAVRLVLNPNLTSVKSYFMNLNVEIVKSAHPQFTPISQEQWEQVGDTIENHIERYTKSTRMLLMILAYGDQNQRDLLPTNLEIEHILPQRWTKANLFGYDHDDVRDELERIGNKILLEKRTNIQAGNNSFWEKKTRYYTKSPIASVQQLARTDRNDWTPEDIKNRSTSIKWKLMKLFTTWEPNIVIQ